jgi:hypothetical protein
MTRLGTRLICAAAVALILGGNLWGGLVEKSGNKGPGPLGDLQTAVCRFHGIDNSSYAGRPVLVISVSKAANKGDNLKLAVPNQSVDDRKVNPPMEVSELVKKCKQGDFLDVSYRMDGDRPVLDRLAAYEIKPGEEEPNVFIFGGTKDEKAGTKEIPCITVTKFRVEGEFQLPQARVDGKMAVKPEIAKVVDGLKSGDLVEILATPGKPFPMVRSIKVFEPPKWGKFVRLDKQTVGEQELNAVHVDSYGNGVTLVIAKKDAGNLMGKVRPLKEGALVIFKGTTDDKGTVWLNQITIAPKGAKMPPEPSKEDATGDDTKPDKTEKPKDPKKKPDAGGKKTGDTPKKGDKGNFDN